MDKVETDAKHVLKQLGTLSSFLTRLDATAVVHDYFSIPMEILRKTMSFDVSVLYKITNQVENRLLLKIVKVFDPEEYRQDLVEGKRLQLDMDKPDPLYVNEVLAFKKRCVSSINVPENGCDIMGFVFLPESFGKGYLLGGDFCGKQSAVKDYEVSVCEIICNFLSTILIKTEFENLAVYDSLTTLYNSRKIKEEVERIRSRLGRASGRSASLVLGDIDHFKTINDTYGHIQGDIVLKEMGKLLNASMRENFDSAGRYGGEEFLLIFEDTDILETHAVVERIRKTIENTSFTRTDRNGKPVLHKYLRVTMSFGISENNAPDGTIRFDSKEWISRADRALYLSKKNGRNRTTLCQE
ncbi:MAG: GGDEF domain-containing protein [Pseudomonadota bacterium]